METARALAAWTHAARRETGGRSTEENKIHLTLAFLGEADAGKAVAAARRVTAKRHTLPIEEARYVRENRMVWVRPRATPAALTALFDSLSLELYRDEFVLERRPFAAHVTLIRKASRPKALPPLPEVQWPVNEFLLVRSALSSAGSSYETLERFPLS